MKLETRLQEEPDIVNIILAQTSYIGGHCRWQESINVRADKTLGRKAMKSGMHLGCNCDRDRT